MLFSGLELSRRLERAEGEACLQFAEARGRLFPASGAAWKEFEGAYAVFDGIESPVTQSFGLGLFQELNAATLQAMERFFIERGAPAVHEVSPFAGVGALNLLCAQGYRPIEISSVLYAPVARPADDNASEIQVRVVGPEEARLWSQVSARGWSHQHPELADFAEQAGILCAARPLSPCFLAEIDGKAGAAGVLNIYQGVALFGGAATVPELRRRGLQGALLEHRMRYAFHHGCDLAMMVAEAGSESQRNAERQGFQIAYTRMKWRLAS